MITCTLSSCRWCSEPCLHIKCPKNPTSLFSITVINSVPALSISGECQQMISHTSSSHRWRSEPCLLIRCPKNPTRLLRITVISYVCPSSVRIWRVSADDKSHIKWLTTESMTTHSTSTLLLMSRCLLVTSEWPPLLKVYVNTKWPTDNCCALFSCWDTWSDCITELRRHVVISHKGTSQDCSCHTSDGRVSGQRCIGSQKKK